ncbi:type II toxin-antitoxin system RelE/ParE family toxin [uncultured Clostridium sp.]|uniref:type II toxin-antitoxin system RelE/ParE family toxin n=1 Tax=uncultured Clostridium sp. TaxID=59620 RepID=UPI00258CBE64|nr:type II toxin-antitoxin system RelE/ParE family toxin [uncultured Clostridium sp.]
MNVILHSALGEINDILKFANNSRERTDILELFLSLEKNAQGTLESSKIKKIKAVEVKIYEIIKGSLRVFYTAFDGDIYIIHICRKQKNKTELKDIKLAEKRAKEIHHR